jgi:hypothetical protein
MLIGSTRNLPKGAHLRCPSHDERFCGTLLPQSRRYAVQTRYDLTRSLVVPGQRQAIVRSAAGLQPPREAFVTLRASLYASAA